MHLGVIRLQDLNLDPSKEYIWDVSHLIKLWEKLHNIFFSLTDLFSLDFRIYSRKLFIKMKERGENLADNSIPDRNRFPFSIPPGPGSSSRSTIGIPIVSQTRRGKRVDDHLLWCFLEVVAVHFFKHSPCPLKLL